jgi:soluble lytic murein transglycosylase-like protein
MADLTRYDGPITDALSQYPAVPESWIRAVIGTETSYNDAPVTWEPKANEYAYGPMQVLLSTAAGLGFNLTPDQLQDPETNILVGTALINSLLPAAGGDFKAMYSAYNSGSVSKYLTSSQVAANVNHALTWLDTVGGYVSAAAASAAATVGDVFGDSSTLLWLGILGVLWYGLSSKRRL